MLLEEQECALVTRATQRDTDAFSQLYRLYFDRIYRYARLKLASDADAEDLASAVFFNAWRTIDRFAPRGDTSFAAWLFRLARNALIDRYRRERDTVSLDGDSPSFTPAEMLPGPDALLEKRLTLDELRDALQTLTEEQREVVLLRFVEGLSAREVGHIMGKQEGAVRGMQFRAIEALRRALAQGGGSVA